MTRTLFPRPLLERIRKVPPGHAAVAGIAAGSAALMLCGAAALQTPPAEPDLARGSRLLSIEFSRPAPLAMPGAAAAGEKLAVLTDAPADLTPDPDMEGARAMASLAAYEKSQTLQAARDEAAFAAEQARLMRDVDPGLRSARLEPAAVERKAEVDTGDVAGSGDTGARGQGAGD